MSVTSVESCVKEGEQYIPFLLKFLCFKTVPALTEGDNLSDL